MGNCQYCGTFTQQHCNVCMLYACRPHMIAHFFSQSHRSAAASRGVKIDDLTGAPINE